MNILIYSQSFFPNTGGIEILTLNLAKEFKKAGHKVKVITYTIPDKSVCDIEIIYHPKWTTISKLYLACDVFYQPNLSLKVVWLLLINPFKKWVISHNTWYFNPDSPNYFIAFVKQLFLFKSSNISVSNSVAKSIWAPSRVIYNAYNNHIFFNKNINRNKDFLFVGRLVSSKGIQMLIEAFSFLQKKFNSITLSIVGTGPEESTLKDLVIQLNLNDSIYFLGNKSQEEVSDIMNSHTFLVVPSIGSEAFGIVVLEGLASGCSLIVSNSTGLIEAIDSFGLVYNKNSISELYNALENLFLGNSDFDKQALTTYLAEHSIKNVASQYLKLFRGNE